MPSVQEYFKNEFPDSGILFTSSGRAALQAAVKDFNLENSKIILPSFICSDVFSPLLAQNNIEPILVDSPKNRFNITFEDVKKAYDNDKKKNKNYREIKAVLIVHCFGQVNKDIEKIKKLCENKKLVLIEDCAHCINLKFNGKDIGSFGDASVFSLSKLGFSLGGVYVRNKGEINIRKEVKKYKISKLDVYNFLQNYSIGKFLIKILKKFGLKSKINVNPKEIELVSMPEFTKRKEISGKIDIEKRKKIALAIYSKLREKTLGFDKNNNFFYSVPILVENRDKVFKKLVENGIRCNKMWTNPLKETPNASFFSKRVINILVDERNNPDKILSVLNQNE